MRHLSKKLIGWMLCLAMAVGMLPGMAREAKAEKGEATCSGIKYAYDSSTKKASVVKDSRNGDVETIIPSKILINMEEYEVTSIGDSAFYGCDHITSITIPSSVTSIGNYAFFGCNRLTSITIPSSVTSIGNTAFYGCSGLTSITIPGSVTSIADDVFQDCSGLTSITIQKGVNNLNGILFSFCENLSEILVEDDNEYYCSDNGILFNKDKTTLIYYPSKKTGEYNIPISVTSIGDYAFHGCWTLSGISIPSSVTSIGERAFYGCTGLTSIIIPSSVTDIGAYAFYGCTGLTGITIPSSETNIGEAIFGGCTGLTDITIPKNVTSIGEYMFYECTGLTDITIPSSITTIGTNAFAKCTGLSSISIPDSVTSIGVSAFYACTSLTSITIPSSVTSIEGGVFQCSGLTSIIIPNSITSIGRSAFDGCTGLTDIAIPDSVTSIDDGAFYECTSLTSITIPSSVTDIGLFAFQECTGLTSIVFKSSNTTIAGDIFFNCDEMKTVWLPDGADDIYFASFLSQARVVKYNCNAGLFPDNLTYSGADQSHIIKEFINVQDGSITLEEGDEYKVEFRAEGEDEWTDKCINAGTYKVKLVGAKTEDRYVGGVTDDTWKFTINPSSSDLTVSLADSTYDYDGTAKAIVNNPTTNVSDGTTITYSFDENGTYTKDLSSLTKTEPGNYNIYIKADNPNYNTATATAKLIIKSKKLTITAGNASKQYDGTALTKNSYTNTALAVGDTIESVTITGSQSATGKSDNVPSAAVIKNAAGEDVSSCYDITYINGSLEVTKKALTITADSASKEYDKIALTKDSYTCTGLSNGDTIKSVTIIGSQTMKGSSENVPSKAVIVNAKGEDVTSSYDITYKNGTLTVTAPDAPSLDDDQKPAPKKDLKEDGKEQILVLDPANLPEGYTIEYSTDGGKTWKPIPTGTRSGEYTIEVLYKADENHTDFFGDTLNVIIQGVYNQTESDGDWTKGSGKTYTFRIKKAFNDEVTYDNLTGVFVDGKKAESGKDYTPAKGSAIITFAADYLETLSVGEHMIRVVFKDGEVTVPLKILAAIATPTPAVDATPVTGDTANPFLWVALVLLSMAGVAVMVEKKRRKA